MTSLESRLGVNCSPCNFAGKSFVPGLSSVNLMTSWVVANCFIPSSLQKGFALRLECSLQASCPHCDRLSCLCHPVWKFVAQSPSGLSDVAQDNHHDVFPGNSPDPVVLKEMCHTNWKQAKSIRVHHSLSQFHFYYVANKTDAFFILLGLKMKIVGRSDISLSESMW